MINVVAVIGAAVCRLFFVHGCVLLLLLFMLLVFVGVAVVRFVCCCRCCWCIDVVIVYDVVDAVVGC